MCAKKYSKKKDEPGAQTKYRTPSRIKSQSKYGENPSGVNGKSQVVKTQTSFKVQHKG